MPGSPAAQCDYAVATVAVAAGTGTQAISIDCGGKTPKGGLLIATRGTAMGTHVAGAMISIAVWDAAGNTRLVACMIESGVVIASANSGRQQSNATILQELSTSDHTITGSAAFSSVSADTLTINITDAFVGAIQIEVLAFYGDTTLCHVDQLTLPTVNGNSQTETGIPFMPRALIAIGAAGGFNTSATSARMAFGVCAFNDDGTVQGQCGMPFFDRNNATIAAATGGGFRTDSILQKISVSTVGVLTEDGRYEVVAATSDGFTVTNRADTDAAMAMGYLAIYTGKLRAWVGAPSIDTTATGDNPITTTGPGFRPRCLLALGSRQNQGNVNTYVSGAESLHFSVGMAVTGAQACANVHAADSAAPNSLTESLSAETLVSIRDGSALDWEATLVSFDSSPPGFTVNVNDASGTDRLVGFLAFEDGSYPQWWDALVPGRPRAARRLARM